MALHVTLRFPTIESWDVFWLKGEIEVEVAMGITVAEEEDEGKRIRKK